MAKVSIVLPFYNAEKTILRTLDSIISQSEQDFEIVFVDDCSSDRTMNHVEKSLIHFKQYQIVSLGANQGPGSARNRGIQQCSSNLIALIDADDIWSPRKLEIQLAIHEATKCCFSCTAFKFGNNYIFQGRTDYISLLKNNVINTSTVVFDQTRLQIDFQSTYKSEDYIAWLDVAKKTQIQFINLILAERLGFDGLSSNKMQMAIKRWQVYREAERLGVIPSIYYFCHYAISGIKKYTKI